MNSPGPSATLAYVLLTTVACNPTSGSETSEAQQGEDDPKNSNEIILERETGPEAPDNCGDGILDEIEACDDGNREGGDGCFANCLGVDPGYICPKEGEPCFEFAVCGDGIFRSPEQCEDGNTESGDGCADNCKVEIGWKCDERGCSPTVCGDGIIEGAELCEPALDPRCTPQCQFAPACPDDGGACSSVCGDGLVLGEECDDGNNTDNDGCSGDCKVEQGFECKSQVTGDACDRSPTTGECILRAPTIFRDFAFQHEDFDGCTGTGRISSGLVEPELDPTGNPVASSRVGATAAGVCLSKLEDWYVDSGESTVFGSEILLYDDGAGNFVNRWGPAGERWVTPDIPGCDRCVPGEYDGNPFFYPVDGIPGARQTGEVLGALITLQYGMGGTTYWDPENVPRNFHFTSEVTFWFSYEDDTNARLEFVGDDDVWVFVNGKLALDLGGIHPALPGEFTVSGASGSFGGGTGAAHGMTPGEVYQIKVFHAERQANGSSFKLTLSGFDTNRSDCRPECGDGVVAFGEQCDEGANNGTGHNRCGHDCQLSSYCGDGIVSVEEECDDADTGPSQTPNCINCKVIVPR